MEISRKIQIYLNNSDLTEYEVGINEMFQESDSSFNKFIILEFTEIVQTTEKALLLARIDKIKGETNFWIPKSLCTINENDNLIAIPIFVLDYK